MKKGFAGNQMVMDGREGPEPPSFSAGDGRQKAIFSRSLMPRFFQMERLGSAWFRV